MTVMEECCFFGLYDVSNFDIWKWRLGIHCWDVEAVWNCKMQIWCKPILLALNAHDDSYR